MAKDSSEDLTQNDSQDNNAESTELNMDSESDNTESVDIDTEETSIDEQIEGENNDTESADKEADIGKLEGPQTHKLAQNNLPLIFIALAALTAIVVAYFWISSNKDKKSDTGNQVPFEGKKPDTATTIPVPLLSKSSEVPKGIAAVAPPQPQKTPETTLPEKTKTITVKSPSPPAIPALLSPDQIANTGATDKKSNKNTKLFEAKTRHNTKRKSSIMLKSDASSTKQEKTGKNNNQNSADINSANGIFNPGITKASTTKLTKIGNMTTTITQGKILDAVLETPINTLYPGPIRAVISRDVYSERGNNVLIPKGSRIIGTLKGGYTAGQTRVAVTWSRIILPSGYDIEIANSPGVGKLGTIGIEGSVNRQFIETVGNAALLSLINLSAAKIIEEQFSITPTTSISSTSSSGTTTRTQTEQSPTKQAAENAVNNLSSVTKSWLSKNFLSTPYIVINQGTRVKVFVNQDIRFPKNINSSPIK